MMPGSRETRAVSAIVLLLIDEAGLFRDSLVEMLRVSAADFRILCVDRSFELASGAIEKPDIVLLDIGRRSLVDDGVRSDVRLTREAFPQSRIMVMCEQESQAEALEALRFGLSGYFPGSLGLDMLIAGVRLIAAGGIFLPPRTLESVPHAKSMFGKSGQGRKERRRRSLLRFAEGR
jgi:DNA-binding NarL/FixJ family response regulator